MLEKFLNKNVLICIADYAAALEDWKGGTKALRRKGIVTNVDEKYIELDNNEVIAIKYITTIKVV